MGLIRLASFHCRPVTGLALSGGGARGLAHIGVLKALEREQIPIDRLAGTSMGGVIAAGYAAGFSPLDLEREALKLNNARTLLSLIDWAGPESGSLIHGSRMAAYFERQLQQRTFADLAIPLALVAVDLNKGQEVIMQEGPLVTAIRATMAVPGLLAPVIVEGKRLVDGGLLNNLPADVARAMGAELVIAVDVGSKPGAPSGWDRLLKRRFIPKGLVEVMSTLSDALVVLSAPQQERKLAQARPHVILNPPIPPDVTLFTGYGRAAELIAIGEQAAQAALPHIRSLLQPRLRWPAWRKV